MKRNVVCQRGCATFLILYGRCGVSSRDFPASYLTTYTGHLQSPNSDLVPYSSIRKEYLESRRCNLYGGPLPVVHAVSGLNRGVTFYASAIAQAYIRQGLPNLKNAVCNAWAVIMYEQSCWRWKKVEQGAKVRNKKQKNVDSDRTRTCARERN